MKLDEAEQAVLNQLELLVRIGRSVDDAAEQLRKMRLDAALIGKVVEFRTGVAREQRQHTVDDGALLDPEIVGTPWYTGPSENDVFWPALRDALSADPSWAPAVPSIDEASTDIVGVLADPHSPLIKTRGLVVGYVQSGKTANFTATIAKAADAGYRMFIVLSGVHNALRRQTQIRLERQLHDLEPKRWLTLTDEHRDFGNPVKALALVAGTDLRLLAVVKKNASRLRRLRDWLYAAQDHGGFDTCPVLIIDDEADQASPNAARNPDLDRTRVNEMIVDVLRLPRVAYVGYTATPFANVLIDPYPPEDLYPRHFIQMLKKPSEYFGAEELFGLGRTGEEDEPGHDMVRLVDDDEAMQHRVRRGEDFEATLTPSLATAISWFLLATAARRARTGTRPHSSMLIHTTERVAPQFAYLPVVREAVREVRGMVDRAEPGALRDLWETETEREPASTHGLSPVSFDAIWDALPSVLDDIKVVVDNGQSVDRLLYDDQAGTTVIAIGGNTLSRGLTLEGLVSSFFLRGANAYDTLMQMGRWFGYRSGYADLPRIWTTSDLIDGFRFLADVERDLRLEIERYSVERTTPSDVGVRIRTHPRMQITSRLRMQFAVTSSFSFSGQRPQTILFHHRDPATTGANLTAARELIASSRATGATDPAATKLIIRDVPAAVVTNFLKAYRFHEDSEMSSDLLVRYIEQQNDFDALETWNVAVITRAQETTGTVDLGFDDPVNLIERSRLRNHSTATTANIGTLMSKPDRVADLMEAREATALRDPDLVTVRTASGRGLLLLYPIAAKSQPKDNKDRDPLDAVDDLIGVALAFPRASLETDAGTTVTVDLSRIRPVMPDVDEGAPDDEYVDQEGDRDDVDLGDGG